MSVWTHTLRIHLFHIWLLIIISEIIFNDSFIVLFTFFLLAIRCIFSEFLELIFIIVFEYRIDSILKILNLIWIRCAVARHPFISNISVYVNYQLVNEWVHHRFEISHHFFLYLLNAGFTLVSKLLALFDLYVLVSEYLNEWSHISWSLLNWQYTWIKMLLFRFFHLRQRMFIHQIIDLCKKLSA